MRDHTKLQAFHLANELVLAIYAVTRKFPSEERFGLTSQLRRAGVSVGANIVEGCARHTEGDYLRFLSLAYASAKELEYTLSIAVRLGYLSDCDVIPLVHLATRTSRALSGIQKALRKSPTPAVRSP